MQMKRAKSLYMPLSYKLLISYLVLVLAPIIALGSYAYLSSVRSTEEHARSNLEVAVKQIASNVDFRLKDMVRSTDELYADQTLARYLAGYHSGWEKYSIMSQYILPSLKNAANLPDPEVGLAVYVSNPDVGEFYYNDHAAGDVRKYSLFHMDRIEEEDWYRRLNLHYSSREWRQVGNDNVNGSISYLRPLINYDTLELNGLIQMTANMKYIFSDAVSGQLGEDSILFVVDEGNRLLFTSSRNGLIPDLLSSAASGYMKQPKSYMQIKQPVTNMPASIVAWIPYASLQKNSQQVRNVTIGICLVTLVLLVLISLAMSQYFSRSFQKLVASLKSFQEGDFHKRMPVKGNDEFAEIGSAFNDMASTIQRLIDEVYVVSLEKKETELQVLHSQMNPHFLYNTFSSISRMAKLGRLISCMRSSVR